MAASPIIQIRDLTFTYASEVILRDVNLDVYEREVLAVIGPSGCGKSSLLRCINRMNETLPAARMIRGTVHIDGQDIYAPDVDVTVLRKHVGMVFQSPNPFAKTVYDNLAYGLRIQGIRARATLDEAVERSLRAAALWDELKDRLNEDALTLSGGQQQRLCIARALAVKPSILLMDEPCSALDPIATAKVEELIHEFKKDYTIVIVTHNMQQAARVSDKTAFFYLGERVEFNRTDEFFMNPINPRTEAYISGRFG